MSHTFICEAAGPALREGTAKAVPAPHLGGISGVVGAEGSRQGWLQLNHSPHRRAEAGAGA